MKISVIIPCYNAEKYIEKCLDSLINQSIKDIEIIAINDGSSDNTKAILEKYDKKYDIISVVNTPNGGQSRARNIGLEKATGDYIAFIDSDDYANDTLKIMYEKAISNDYDVVFSDVNIVYPNFEKRISSGLENDTSDKNEIKKALVYSYSASVVWNKLYKRELLKDMKFKEGVWFEDVEYNFRLFPKIKNIGVVKEIFVNYIQNEGSVTYTYNERLYDFINNFNGLITYYKDNNLYDDFYNELEYSYIRYSYNTFIKRLAKCGNFSTYMKGVKYAKKEVKMHFPKYRKNHYIRRPNSLTRTLNSIYFIFFNKLFALFIYVINIGKMN